MINFLMKSKAWMVSVTVILSLLGTYEVLIMEYLTTVEMSERWNITSRRIGVLCAEGRVERL